MSFVSAVPNIPFEEFKKIDDEYVLPKEDKTIENSNSFSPLSGLTSQFFYYEWKSIKIRPFTLEELDLIHLTNSTKELLPLIQAIDNTINRDVFDLTLGDFELLCFWQRMNSYKQNKMAITWKCNEKLCPNKNCHGKKKISIVNMSNLKINTIEEKVEIPENMDIPRMRHFLEINRRIKEFPKRENIIRAAAWMKGETVKEKIENLGKYKNNPLENYEMATILSEKLGGHGVSEFIQILCRDRIDENNEESLCGRKFNHQTRVDFGSFFP